jgi:hypothetical protein
MLKNHQSLAVAKHQLLVVHQVYFGVLVMMAIAVVVQFQAAVEVVVIVQIKSFRHLGKLLRACPKIIYCLI